MDEEQQFLRAIIEGRDEPGDLTRRLVFADWLEEQGDPRAEYVRLYMKHREILAAPERTDLRLELADILDRLSRQSVNLASLQEAFPGIEDTAAVFYPTAKPRAEFIRVQCELAGDADLPRERREDLLARERDLLTAHRDEWAEPLRELAAANIGFSRGLPGSMTIHAEYFLQNADAIFATAPIRKARISVLEGIDDLLASSHLRGLNALSLSSNCLGRTCLRALAQSPNVSNLEELDLSNNHFGDASVAELAASEHLGNLKTLILTDTGISGQGARTVLDSEHLAGVTALGLSYNRFGDDGLEQLATSPNLARLKSLRVNGCSIGDAGVRSLTDSEHTGSLERLGLCGNALTDEGARFLSEAWNLAGLNELDVRGNLITDQGARLLANPENMPNLAQIDLQSERIGPSCAAQVNEILASRRKGRSPGGA